MNIKRIDALRRFSAEKMQKVNLFETERMFCDIYCLLPGQSQSRHAHEGADKVYAVLEGEVRVTIGGETTSVAAGEVVCAPAGEEHGVENVASLHAVLLVFMAPPPAKKPSDNRGGS